MKPFFVVTARSEPGRYFEHDDCGRGSLLRFETREAAEQWFRDEYIDPSESPQEQIESLKSLAKQMVIVELTPGPLLDIRTPEAPDA